MTLEAGLALLQSRQAIDRSPSPKMKPPGVQPGGAPCSE